MMANTPDPDFDECLRALAMAEKVLATEMEMRGSEDSNYETPVAPALSAARLALRATAFVASGKRAEPVVEDDLS